MKHLILSILFLLIVDLSFAQESVIYRCKSEEECNEFSKEFIKYTQKNYELERTNAHFDLHCILYYEQEEKYQQNPSPLAVIISYHPYLIGGNAALEIEGETIYILHSIEGRYLDIFPIWKKFFAPEADSIETSTEKAVFSVVNVVDDIKYKYKFTPALYDKTKKTWVIERVNL